MRAVLPRRRTVIVLAVLVGLALTLIGIGVYRLIHGPTQPPRSIAAPTGATSPSTSPTSAPILRVPESTDPVVYARGVAAALFRWDTSGSVTRTEYLNALMTQSDPASADLGGLYADLTAYLPTPPEWQQLAQYSTRQSLTIASAAIPTKTWDRALAAGGNTIPKGTWAVTIDGTRHREGVWLGTPTSSTDHVSFTVFVTCPPTTQACRLVRLSALNTPLR